MHFDLTPDQKTFRYQARKALTEPMDPGQLTAQAPGGHISSERNAPLLYCWPGAAVSTERGGHGLGAVGLATFMEEVGYACASSSLAWTATAAAVIDACASDHARTRWLPELLSGARTAAIATPLFPVDVERASMAVIVDRRAEALADRARIVALDSEGDCAPGTLAEHGESLGGGAVDRVLAAVAAEIVGICQRMLDISVPSRHSAAEMSDDSFTTIAHLRAHMILNIESARSTAYYAAWAADANSQRFASAAAAAAAVALDAAHEVTASALRIERTDGLSSDFDLHQLRKRALLDAAILSPSRQPTSRLPKLAAGVKESFR